MGNAGPVALKFYKAGDGEETKRLKRETALLKLLHKGNMNQVMR